jgi:hypothetical protein
MRIIRAGGTKQTYRLCLSFLYERTGRPDTTRPEGVPAHFASGLRIPNNTPGRKSASGRRRSPDYILTNVPSTVYASRTGTQKPNLLPLPSSLSAQTSPPCARAM